MGTNMSGQNVQALTWLEARIASWVADPTGIGLTSGQTTSLATEITNARNAFTSVEAIRTESQNKTTTFKTVADGMRQSAAPMIANIKNFADNAADPDLIYTAAGVLPTDPRSPAAPPSQPSTLDAKLNGDGSVTINFQGTGPTGTAWQVQRKLALETSYTFIGNADVATKSFTDVNIPAGVASATYQVQGIRGSVLGPVSFPFTVPFGTADAAASESSQAA